MKRVVLNGPGDLSIEFDDEPAPGPGEVLVEVAGVGICGSDLHAFRGEHPLVMYPVTPGHEFSGTVVAVGEGAQADLEGSRVCIEPSLYCGRCPRCRSGRYNICDNLKVLGFQAPGAMCGFIAVPEHRVHPLPPGVGLVDGALAEPTAVSVHALSRSGVQEGRPVLIVGAGMIGLVLMKAAGAIGCPVVVVEATAERVGRALDLGADKAFAFDEVEPGEVAAAAGPDGFGAVFECVGSPGTIDFAVRAAPRGGTVVAVGVFPGAVPVPMSLVQDGEVEIRGTLMYRGEDFKRALELLDGGLVRADDIITHRLALDEVERAYRLAGDPGARSLKVMLEL